MNLVLCMAKNGLFLFTIVILIQLPQISSSNSHICGCYWYCFGYIPSIQYLLSSQKQNKGNYDAASNDNNGNVYLLSHSNTMRHQYRTYHSYMKSSHTIITDIVQQQDHAQRTVSSINLSSVQVKRVGDDKKEVNVHSTTTNVSFVTLSPTVEKSSGDTVAGASSRDTDMNGLIRDDTETDINDDNSIKNGCMGGWMKRYQQLQEFYHVNGHTIVPKRYPNNPSLGNWVNKQRQLYRYYYTIQQNAGSCRNDTKVSSSLTQERIELLNSLQFCWNASSITYRSMKNKMQITNATVDSSDNIEWWSSYNEIRKFCVNDTVHNIGRQSKLGIWLDRQRKVYRVQTNYCNDTINVERRTAPHRLDRSLTNEQVTALSNLSADWYMTYRDWQWEKRYRELQSYRIQYGHCCVPISYSYNQPLAHWVSNQRKLYNLQRSELTSYRIQKLEAIGFVWNRWEYEFNKKKVNDFWL